MRRGPFNGADVAPRATRPLHITIVIEARKEELRTWITITSKKQMATGILVTPRKRSPEKTNSQDRALAGFSRLCFGGWAID